MCGVLCISNVIGFGKGKASVGFWVFRGMGSSSKDGARSRVKVLAPLVLPCCSGQLVGAGLLTITGQSFDGFLIGRIRNVWGWQLW